MSALQIKVSFPLGPSGDLVVTLGSIAILFIVSFAVEGCICDGSSDSVRAESTAPQREAWLSCCLHQPQSLLDVFREIADDSIGGRRLPASVDQFVSHMLDIPVEQLDGTVDWARPAQLVLVEPQRGRPLWEGLVVQLQRPAGASLVQGSVTRRIETSKGLLHLEAEGERLFVSPSSWALAASRQALAAGEGVCPSDMVVTVAPQLLASQSVKSWVARQGAWLESTARQGTARHGRSELGDPEVAARLIASWLERRRARAEAAAPLKVRFSLSSEALHLDLRGRNIEDDSQGRPDANTRNRAGGLGFVAPDAYFAVSSWSSTAERQSMAQNIVDAVTRIAGERMPLAEQRHLQETVRAIVENCRGWSTVALRPALEPGPIVVIVALESRDPLATTEAIQRLAEQFTRGQLQRILEYLGVHLTLAQGQNAEKGESMTFATKAPMSEAARSNSKSAPSVLRTMLGATPRLAWERHEDLVFLAFGPEPERELQRMREASISSVGTVSSVVAQPVLSQVLELSPDADVYGFVWIPALANLFTHGGPGAGELPSSGLAFSSGSAEESGQWQTTLRVDQAQFRSMLRWISGRRMR